ncbi:MAG: M23 family metallopeptidase [Bacillota bacterium]|nr:M23 family metallopeptidase [Bacillota bacterium]
MDKNKSNSILNFFKKEGFYVLLFVCLCIVAVAAVISTNNTKAKHNTVSSANVTPAAVGSASTQEAQKLPTIQPDNALQVKSNVNEGSTVNKTASSGTQTTAVSKTIDTNFTKPVDGTLVRSFSLDPVYWDSTSSFRANLGEDIKCDLGKAVVSVLDGTVQEINANTPDGVQVIISHQNGIKTVYSNLDSNVFVKKDQVVKKGDQIGKVGKTTVRAAYEKYGTHLHFQVLNGKDYVDPAKYVKY